ncbi:glutaredoxin domain-containing protein [Planococcus salinarum]|nr:glutaredoxin domain-containing protein [Planococcus salinarum]TAA73365.1 glutaredoxin [Planococcus salinarum]
MVNPLSFLINGQVVDCSLFVVPGCTKCEEVKSKLNELSIPFQICNIFEHRLLLQNVTVEKKRQGFPLLKMGETYYTYTKIMALEI